MYEYVHCVCTTVSSNGNDLNREQSRKAKRTSWAWIVVCVLCKCDMHVFWFFSLSLFHHYSLTVDVHTHTQHVISEAAAATTTAPVRKYYAAHTNLCLCCNSPFIHNNVGWNVKKYESFCDCSSLIWFSYDSSQKLNKSTFWAQFMRFLCNQFSLFSLAVFSIVFSRSFHISLFLFTYFASVVGLCLVLKNLGNRALRDLVNSVWIDFDLSRISFLIRFDICGTYHWIDKSVYAFGFLTLKSWNGETLSHCRLIADTPGRNPKFTSKTFSKSWHKDMHKMCHDAANFSLKLNWPIETFWQNKNEHIECGGDERVWHFDRLKWVPWDSISEMNFFIDQINFCCSLHRSMVKMVIKREQRKQKKWSRKKSIAKKRSEQQTDLKLREMCKHKIEYVG